MMSADEVSVENDSEVLQTLTRRAVARALVAVERGRPLDDEVRAGLQLACDAARQQGLQAERVIVMVKKSWRDLTDRRILQRRLTDEALSDVVTVCIDEYYRINQ